jgi:hypothetical protein
VNVVIFGFSVAISLYTWLAPALKTLKLVSSSELSVHVSLMVLRFTTWAANALGTFGNPDPWYSRITMAFRYPYVEPAWRLTERFTLPEGSDLIPIIFTVFDWLPRALIITVLLPIVNTVLRTGVVTAPSILEEKNVKS